MPKLQVKDVSEKMVKKISLEYLEKYSTVAVLASKHNVCNGTISKILFRGIAENIVDDDTATKIVEKIVNSYKFGKDERRTRWNLALAQRKK